MRRYREIVEGFPKVTAAVEQLQGRVVDPLWPLSSIPYPDPFLILFLSHLRSLSFSCLILWSGGPAAVQEARGQGAAGRRPAPVAERRGPGPSPLICIFECIPTLTHTSRLTLSTARMPSITAPRADAAGEQRVHQRRPRGPGRQHLQRLRPARRGTPPWRHLHSFTVPCVLSSCTRFSRLSTCFA